MARPRILLCGLLCLLLASGCISSSKSSLGWIPFNKKSATASTTPKQPLTQVALDALNVKPKKNTNVKIVSPLDWFRGKASDAHQLSNEQMTALAEKYRAAVAGRVGAGLAAGAQPSIPPALQQPTSPLATNTMLPSQISTPVAPQFSNSLATNATATRQQPTIQLQSGQLPAGQSQFARMPAAQYATAGTGLNPSIAAAQHAAPQTASSMMPPPPAAALVGDRHHLPTAPNLLPSPPKVPPTTATTTYPTTNQPVYPTTSEQPLPSLSTSIGPTFGPTYR